MHISRRDFIKAGAAGLGAMAADGLARNLPGTSSPPASAAYTRIALGSCLRDSANAAVLEQVVKADPDAFLWLGDNIYGDTQDMAVLQGKYKALGDNKRFQALFAHCPNLAIWDNHDYGYSRVGAEHPKKRESQKIFLDFWKVPADDPRRKRDGIYHSRMIGEAPRNVQVILLDCRFWKTQTEAEAGGTILGETQWDWLEEQLRMPAALRIVCSSIQVVPDEHQFDGWSLFPLQRQRLYTLIRTLRAGGVVFTSGDQHWAELSRSDNVLGYPAHDLTASALDQEWDLPANRLRVGTGSRTASFGLIEVEWDKPEPLLRFKILSAPDSAVVLDHAIKLSVLHPWGSVGVEAPAHRPGARRRDGAGGDRPEIPGLGTHTLTGRKLPAQ